MSFESKIDLIVQEVADEYRKWGKEQERSCVLLKSLLNIAESLEVLSRMPKGQPSKWGALAPFIDLPDRLLVKEIDSLNKLSMKLNESLKRFEEVCSSLKRARKKAFRLIKQQKGLLPSDLSESSAVSFSVAEKLSWFDSLERAIAEELAVKSALLVDVRYDRAEQVSRLMQKWEKQACLDSVSSVVERLMFPAMAKTKPP